MKTTKEKLNEKLNELRNNKISTLEAKKIVSEIRELETELKNEKLTDKITGINKKNSIALKIQKDILKLGAIDRDLFTDSMTLHKTKVKKRPDILEFIKKYERVRFSIKKNSLCIHIYVNYYTLDFFIENYDYQTKTNKLIVDLKKACKENKILMRPLKIDKVKRDLEKIISEGEKIRKIVDNYDKKINNLGRYFYENENFLSRSTTNLYYYL